MNTYGGHICSVMYGNMYLLPTALCSSLPLLDGHAKQIVNSCQSVLQLVKCGCVKVHANVTTHDANSSTDLHWHFCDFSSFFVLFLPIDQI